MIGIQVFGDCHRIDFDFRLDNTKQKQVESVVGVEAVLQLGRYYIVINIAEQFDKLAVIEDVVTVFDPTADIELGKKTKRRCPNGCGQFYHINSFYVCWGCGYHMPDRQFR